ncbi:ArdC family protein [Roseobacter sp. HKCCA0434]|uniref:ArdC family protein n=1 Tax=Roseobacter sp. HKCCA0434 TaxID=3079297 RepID=UPI002905856D|nr:ArdC-like ssDNA-binding domain-containing protein [Roseobacter sp. HKCCA0434]
MAKFDIHQEVTDRIIAALEDGKTPWQCPWVGGGSTMPLRATGQAYRGVNVLMLWARAMQDGYTARRWFTFKQAKELGAQVRKGEKGCKVVYYKVAEREREDGTEARIPFLKSYTVFNAEQIDGLPETCANDAAEIPLPGTTVSESLQGFFRRAGVTLDHSDERRAYYDIKADRVHMPNPETFHSEQGYFATLAHESVHWTGAASRLDRFQTFNTKKDLAREELVAEIGAAMLCAMLGIENDYDQNAAYLDSWLDCLREDKRAIFKAATAAQAGADFVMEAADAALVLGEAA